MTSTDIDLRHGDRIQVLPGKASSAHTLQPLKTGLYIELSSIRPDPLDGTVEVTGFLLTQRGAFRSGLPTRTVILTSDAYTTPIRVGDRVRYRATGETPTVTAIHEDDNGFATAAVRFASGAHGACYRLVDLEHLARPTTSPAADPAPVATACAGLHCHQPATNIVLWWPRSGGQHTKALCASDTDQYLAMLNGNPARAIELADGTHDCLADNSATQVATCQHCGHLIYLYRALLDHAEPWRDGEYDETGRCGPGEERARIPVAHEPAVTIAARDTALATRPCSASSGPHTAADCPATRS